MRCAAWTIRRCAAWTILVVLASCTSQYHVRLPEPSPAITPDERVALFWRMRPVTEGQVRVNGDLVNDTIMLADKTEVVSPEDLEPLVGADSETMRYARASIHARRKSNVFFYTSLSMAAVGLVTAFVLNVPVSVAVAGGGLFIASFAPYFLERHYTESEIQLRRKAFDAYPADLGRRLNVCAHENQVVPCDGPLPGQPGQPDGAPGEKLPPATAVPAQTGSLRMRSDALSER